MSFASMISYVSRIFRMPSWWMPDWWRNAFAPTIALFGCTLMPVRSATRRLVRYSSCVLMFVSTLEEVAARLDRHHDFFERGVAGALADAVDARLDLPRARLDGRQRVRDGQPQVVVAVHGDARLVDVRHVLVDVA